MINIILECKNDNPLIFNSILNITKNTTHPFKIILNDCGDSFKKAIECFLKSKNLNDKIPLEKVEKVSDYYVNLLNISSVLIVLFPEYTFDSSDWLKYYLLKSKDVDEDYIKVYFNQQKIPKLLLLSNVYNEEYLLPFWCQYHKNIFDKAIIVDYNSTDRSLEIIREICPEWEIRTTKNECFGAFEIDAEFNQIEEEFDNSYFKVILNTTEFVISDLPLRYLLPNEGALQIKSITPHNDNKIYPKNLEELFNSVTKFSDDLYFRYPRYIHNFSRCNYGLGRHTINHTFSTTDRVYIFWTGFYPWNQFIIQRRLQCKSKVPQHDIEKGYSYHHFWTEEKMEEERNKLSLKNKDISELNIYQSFLDNINKIEVYPTLFENIKLDEKELIKVLNNYDDTININCHFPVLIIHKNVDTIFNFNLKHDFLRYLHYYFQEEHFENCALELKTLLAKYNPRSIITIGEFPGYIFNGFSRFFSYDYRKRWLHYSDLSNLQNHNIEFCAIHALKRKFPEDQKLISVITPAYESKHRILRPYRSLMSQTYPNWEWIIIDDSKSDDTWKTLKEFAERDFRIKVYRGHRNNGSIGCNKKFCANLASGHYIFELDHDDDILPQTFERLIQAGNKYPDAGFFYSDFIECFEDSLGTFDYGDYFGLGFGSYYRSWWNNNWHFFCQTPRMNQYTFRHIVGVPNHFRCWTKKAYLDVGMYNEELQVADDYDLILRTMFKYRWVHIPEMLYIQYRNSGGDNFTFHRNALIQHLVWKLRGLYEDDIHKRLTELGCDDKIYNQSYQGYPKDFTVNKFEFPILEYKYVWNDQDDDNPLISIIVPTYNRSEELKEALDSIFNQTYQNFEVILVGDKCPTLNQFVTGYQHSKDKRFKWYNLNENGGPGGHLPRNYAIKMICNSRWIAYLDDDNTWRQDHLQVFVDEIRKDKDVKVIVNSMNIDGKDLIFDDMRRGRIDTSSVCHHFDLCVKHGLWKDRIEGGYAHDFEFFNRFKDEKIVWTKKVTLNYSTKNNGQSYEQLIMM